MNNPQPVTQKVVRQLLREALDAPTVDVEQEAWNQIVGTVPLWSLAATYCNHRRHALDAIEEGFSKSGASVLSLIEILKQRAPGPKEPEVYVVPDTNALVYLWRTDAGPKPVVLERAPRVKPPPEDGPCPEAYWHWPDQWRQVRTTKVHDHSEWLLDLSDNVTIKWSPDARGSNTAAKVTSFDDRTKTPCHEPGCTSDSIAECGHASMADKLGSDLPTPLNPGPGRVRCQPCTDKDYVSVEVYHVPPACDDPAVAPCEACGSVKCRENGEMVCRAPGCSANPSTPLEHPDGSPEHELATENLQERAAGYREATERSRRVREDLKLGPNPDLDTWTCAVCEGIDPESSDAPNSGHAWQCPLGDKKLSEGYADVDRANGKADAGVPLDPAAPDDLRANPDWSPTGKPEATGTTSEAGTPGPRPDDSAPSATGEGNDPSGDETGIMPDAKCACGHVGQDHDHRTKRCAACSICEGFKAEQQCQGSWSAHNGACGAPDCVALERCRCGCARATHSRPNDECSRCPCIAFRPGEPEPLVTEEMDARAIRDRKFRFAADLDMTKVRKQRKTKKGWACCELCLQPVKEGDEWVSRIGRSVNKRAHLACADEIALEMADAAKAE